MTNSPVFLVCLNRTGKALAVVGPFDCEEDAQEFYDSTAASAYHAFTIVPAFTPESYRKHA